LHDVFMPAYFFFGGWSAVLPWLARLLTLGGALAWLWPRVLPAGRVASAAFCLGGFYVEYIPRSPWYYPGWEALAFVAWAYLGGALLRPETSPQPVRAATRIAVGALVGAQVLVLAAVAWQMRVQQTIIEDGQRTAIGRWLRTHAAPGDRVYLEPLGYIGFFSGLKMLDYPGLASPEVVAARRAGHRPHADLIATLQPEWIVLRPDQIAGVMREKPRLLDGDYRPAKVFDVRSQVEAQLFLPGRGYAEFDALYVVYQRAGPRTGP
jgi:hypothetical protein